MWFTALPTWVSYPNCRGRLQIIFLSWPDIRIEQVDWYQLSAGSSKFFYDETPPPSQDKNLLSRSSVRQSEFCCRSVKSDSCNKITFHFVNPANNSQLEEFSSKRIFRKITHFTALCFSRKFRGDRKKNPPILQGSILSKHACLI